MTMPWALGLSLCGLRGVIRITREVIDKAGLNRLLVPYQSLFLSPINHLSSLQYYASYRQHLYRSL
jgi:hypothetical protein